MRINRWVDRSAKVWVWRILLGPAMVIDGLTWTLTLGFVSFGATLSVSCNLAKARIEVVRAAKRVETKQED